MFELKSVNKTFHLSKTSSLHVLSDVSLTVNQGEIFGLIGLSGAGKSTALRTFNLLEKPNSGQVIINDQILSELKSSDLQKARQKIGMIFQHFNLISNKTVAENIALPLKIAGWKSQDIQTRVEEVLQLVNLSNKRDVYPNQLSGGQKQRVSIARTMANHPHLLLADEPTSALDPFTKMEILDYLVSLNKNFNLTMIIATHEMQIVRKICNRVAIIDGGRVQEILPVVDGVIKPVSEIGKTLLEVT